MPTGGDQVDGVYRNVTRRGERGDEDFDGVSMMRLADFGISGRDEVDDGVDADQRGLGVGP